MNIPAARANTQSMPRPDWVPRRSGLSEAAEAPSDIFKSVQDASASEATGVPAKAKWTVLNYAAADNNLYPYIYNDLAGMEKFGSSANINLVAQLDHLNGGAYRFRVEKDSAQGNPDRIDSPVVESLGAVNMSDPKNLAEFIAWGIKAYPAERYMLIVSDHGKGWQGLVEDESHKGWMSIPQLGQALADAEKASGVKLDVIGFDACQMGAIEVASEIQDRAQFMVASQALEGKEGWPYQHLLGQVPLAEFQQRHIFKADLEPRQAAELIVSSAAQHAEVLPTMSVLDLSQVGELEKRLKSLSTTLADQGLGGLPLREARQNTQSFGMVHDIGDYLNQLDKDATAQASEPIKQAIQACREQLARVVTAEHHSDEFPGANGLSIELRNAGKGYDQLNFAQAAGWKQALKGFA